MYSFDCPVCIAYLEDLQVCDCGCEKYVCEMCGAVFDMVDTEINQVLYRNGIYSDLLAVTEDHGEPVAAPAFRNAENYRRFVRWNSVRMVGVCDQLEATLNDDGEATA